MSFDKEMGIGASPRISGGCAVNVLQSNLAGGSSPHVYGVREGTSIEGTWAVTDHRPAHDNRGHDDYQQQGRDKNCARSHTGKPNSVERRKCTIWVRLPVIRPTRNGCA